MLPGMLLSEPSDSALIREKDSFFISSLKKEMMENPISDVQPILCVVNLSDGTEFQPSLKEAIPINPLVVIIPDKHYKSY